MSEQNLDLNIDLTGMVQIFGDALYKDFGSMIKEIVQNGHDAIIEQAINNASEHELDAKRIDVLFDEYDRLLVVADNGTGMSESDIKENLNNFAKSKKRQIEKSIQERQVNSDLFHVVGEYGVGFLAAMAICDNLSVLSRKQDCNPVQWSYSYGSHNATVSVINRNEFEQAFRKNKITIPDTGTIVIVQIRADVKNKYHFSNEKVGHDLEQFVSLLPVRVYYNEKLLSCRFSAWSQPAYATIQEWQGVIEEAYGDTPLLIVPIYSSDAELGIQGVLWIPERTSFFAEPRLDVYIKRMFVLRDNELVIPEWARFIRGVINSTKMSRIVSGNTLKNDSFLQQTKIFIHDKIIEEFRKLKSKSEPEYWRVIGPHDDAIKGSARDDEEFMECVWDKLRFQSRGKKFSIPEYLKEIKRKTDEECIYQFDNDNQYHAAELVQESTGVPILNLIAGKDDNLVRKICRKQNISIKSYKELAEKQFQHGDDEFKYHSLVDACASWNIYAEARKFSPSYLPAVLIEDSSLSDTRDELLRGLKEHGEKRFAEEFEKIINRQSAANFGISFYLNTDNDLINALVNSNFESQCRIMLALYNISFMAAYPDLKQENRERIFKSITMALEPVFEERIVEKYDTLDKEPDKKNTSSIITLFMITPFSDDKKENDQYKIIEDGARQFFETAPYCFKVHLARDVTYKRSILENVRSHIEKADAYIAEISELRPNVMLELGAAIFTKKDTPIFSLRNEKAVGDVPSDINSELYIPYSLNDIQGVDSQNPICKALKKFLESNGIPKDSLLIELIKKRKNHFLSLTILSTLRYRLTSEEIDSICTHYETIEDFISDKDIASKKTRLKPSLITSIIEELKEMIEKSDNVLQRLVMH